MVQWQVINGNLQIIFQSKEDIIQFIDTVVRPSADTLGLEIIVSESHPTDQKKKILDVTRIQ
ncbi:MAG: hypothetical protein QXW52_09245 [Candidatus Caldarchaeum sp.]